MKKLLVVLLCLGLVGCAPISPYLLRDNPNFINPAKQLVEDYLEGQKKGESNSEAAPQYGSVSEFYGLKEYRFERMKVDGEASVLFYRIQATNKFGGVFWSTYGFWIVRDNKLLDNKYSGLRIGMMMDTN